VDGVPGAALPYIRARVAPSAKRLVACVLGGAVVAFSAFAVVDVLLHFPNPESLDYLGLAAQGVGAGAVVALAWRGALDLSP